MIHKFALINCASGLRASSAKSSEEEEHRACAAFLFISNFLKDFMLYTFYMRYFQLLRIKADAFGYPKKIRCECGESRVWLCASVHLTVTRRLKREVFCMQLMD